MADLVTRILLDNKNFNDNIARSKKELETYNNITSKVTNVIGGLTAGLGLAMGASEAFNKTINSSQSTGDAWTKRTDQMTASVDSFFTSLAMGDFSGFLNNLQNVIQKAGKLADLMDELATKSLFTNSELSGLNMQRQIYLNISKDRSKSDAERKKALLEAENIQKRITALQKSEAGTNRQTANATVRAALAKQGYKGEVADEGINYLLKESNRTNVTARANIYQTKKKAIDYAKNVDSESGIQTHSKESRKLQAEFDKYMKTNLGKVDELFYYFSQMDDSEKSMLASAIALNNKANDMYTQISNAELEQNLSKSKIDGSWKSQNKEKEGKKTKADKEIINKGSINEINKEIAEARKKYNEAATNELRIELFQIIEDLENRKIKLDFEAEFGSNKKMPDLKMAGVAPEGSSKSIKKIKKVGTIINKDDLNLSSDLNDNFQTLATTLGTISQLTNSNTASFLTYISTVLSTIPQVIAALTTLTAVKEVDNGVAKEGAIVNAANSAAQTPVVGWILALSAIAAMTAAMMSIPKFATGGVMGGTSYTGDKLLARINSGEMILNKKQQSNLSNMLVNNSVVTDNSGGKVEFKIDGRQLVGVLNNYNKQQNRIK